MKKEWVKLALLSLCILLLLPWSILRWQQPETPASDFQVRVKMPGGEIEKMPLEEYLVGVVAAEMPATFETEALKAQAVAARTYAARRISQVNLPDKGYDLDTTVNTQSWLSEGQMRQKWGWFSYWYYHSRIQNAVIGTKGFVLVADGEYIDAFYHSSSGRKPTEKPEEVWSTSRPYLNNVNSGEENPLRFVKITSYTPEELYHKLSLPEQPKNFSSTDYQVLSKTTTGRIKSVKLLGYTYLATDLRKLLGLASTDMEWHVELQKITITTYGNGHAVGMSQYGANGLAKKGKTYKEILGYYYQGAKLLSLNLPPTS